MNSRKPIYLYSRDIFTSALGKTWVATVKKTLRMHRFAFKLTHWTTGYRTTFICFPPSPLCSGSGVRAWIVMLYRLSFLTWIHW